jgi:hypothetical protein
MKKNTLEEYKNAIKAKYELTKEEDISGLLNNPSPANIRELCIQRVETLGVDDKSIFSRFFNLKDDENSIKQIENYDTDKLRPVGNFLKSKTKDTKQIIVELIAILIDFTPRPYLKFSKTDEGNFRKVEEIIPPTSEPKEEEKKGYKKPDPIPIALVINEKAKANNDNLTPKSYSIKQKIAFGLGIVLITSISGYSIKKACFSEKQCMQWQNDHYETVDCNEEIDTIYKSAPIIPVDEDALDLNKIKVSDTTTFFRGGKAVVWYCKVDSLPEFFDDLGTGYHPLTGKPLRPITKYIISKYVIHK